MSTNNMRPHFKYCPLTVALLASCSAYSGGGSPVPTIAVTIIDREVEEISDSLKTILAGSQKRYEEKQREDSMLRRLGYSPRGDTRPPPVIPASAKLTLQFCSETLKPVRALSGELVFSDLFGKERVRYACRLDPDAGKAVWIQHASFGSEWLSRTPLDEIRVRFEVEVVAFSDGTLSK